MVAPWVHERLARVLGRHGRSLEGDDDTPSVLAEEQPALASLYDASAADRQLLGEAPGQTTRRTGCSGHGAVGTSRIGCTGR